jgi:hypothetical protein
MSEFAPVAPIQVLRGMYRDDPQLFGEYHLFLAHHTVEKAVEFTELFQQIQHDGVIFPTVIMDNSVVECGGYVSLDMMKKAVDAIDTGCCSIIPVLPDVMGRGAETREAVLEAYEKWANELPVAGFMAVCQGETLEDYEASLRLFTQRGRFPYMEYVGIPRKLVELIGSREEAVKLAVKYALPANINIHLLGYSDNTEDDLNCSRMVGVKGIDSAVPLRVDSAFQFGRDYPPRHPEWFNHANYSMHMASNLRFVRRAHGLQA